jgi:hypothetical protein
MRHIIGKISTRAITFFHISFQLEVFKQSYGPPKLQESQFQEFCVTTLALGSRPRQKACKGASQEEARESKQRGRKGAGQEEPGSHITYSWECKKL